jgi:hypothetical protein
LLNLNEWVIINTDFKIATIFRPNNNKVRLFMIYNNIEKSNGPITEPSITPMSSDKSVHFIPCKQILFCLSNSF